MKIEEIITEKVLDETGMNRVLQHATTRSIGLISACRSDEENPLKRAEVNKKNTHQLMKDLIASGYGYVPVTGSYIENVGQPNETKVIEHSFLVIGNDKEDNGHLMGILKKEAQKFNQETFLYKNYDTENAVLIDSKTGKEVTNLGKFHVGKIGDYSTQLKGKHFTFSNVKLGESKMKYGSLVNAMAGIKKPSKEFLSINKLTRKI